MQKQITGRRFDHGCIEHLLWNLRRLPGKKRLTVAYPSGEFYQLELADGQNEAALLAIRDMLFRLGLSSAGSLLIRQETVLCPIGETDDGDIVRKPQYRVYGAFVANGMFVPTGMEVLKQYYETDADTGKRLPHEPGVHFANIDKLLSAGDTP